MDNTYGYSDLDLAFNAHPVTGDLLITKGEVSVIKAIKNLLMTNRYEKPFKPDYGCNIRSLLFEPMTPFTASTLEKEIDYTIKNYEPRVTLKSVIVDADYDREQYNVRLEFYIENLVQLFTTDFFLTRLR